VSIDNDFELGPWQKLEFESGCFRIFKSRLAGLIHKFEAKAVFGGTAPPSRATQTTGQSTTIHLNHHLVPLRLSPAPPHRLLFPRLCLCLRVLCVLRLCALCAAAECLSSPSSETNAAHKREHIPPPRRSASFARLRRLSPRPHRSLHLPLSSLPYQKPSRAL
jgi:hypothetical protein